MSKRIRSAVFVASLAIVAAACSSDETTSTDTGGEPRQRERGEVLLLSDAREFAQRVPIRVGRLRSDRQPFFHVGIVGSEQNAAIRLDRQHAVPRLEMQPVGHILGDGGADGAADLPEGDFTDHWGMVAFW